jgi:hypothetical protein
VSMVRTSRKRRAGWTWPRFWGRTLTKSNVPQPGIVAVTAWRWIVGKHLATRLQGRRCNELRCFFRRCGEVRESALSFEKREIAGDCPPHSIALHQLREIAAHIIEE